MKDYKYTVTDDGMVKWKRFDIFYISQSTWCSLAPTGLATQYADWVKLILSQLIYMLI